MISAVTLAVIQVEIWHNPRCSKSRATLALLEKNGADPVVRRYLENAPKASEIRTALLALELTPFALIRRGEALFKTLELSAASADNTLISAMAANPILIERPIVFANGKARIGRPPEAVLDIL